MASATKILCTKRRQRKVRQGRKRKNKLARRSTLSAAELFAGLPPPLQS